MRDSRFLIRPMVNPFKEVSWNPTVAERRRFAKSLIVGFPCMALIFLLLGHLAGKGWSLPAAMRIGGIGVGAGLLFLLLPSIAKPFYVLWYAIACCIGLVVGNVLLALLFYVLVTGIALLKRAFGSQPIRKRMDKQATSYWRDAEQPTDLQRYYRQS